MKQQRRDKEFKVSAGKSLGKLFYGFIETTGGALNTVTTTIPGVYAVGACTGPADLEDTVSMAGSAVMKAISMLRKKDLVSS